MWLAVGEKVVGSLGGSGSLEPQIACVQSQQLAAATPIKDLLLHNCSISKLSSERYPQGQSNAMTIASSSNHGS